ncbi:MAG: hypothetical protein A2X13_15440 [Bacteroidetes bacterium GWC2_33_15]|nr:MAG: hypothetical protein A2X10_04725 [Bacteroidetes bacterium GWA2_33_15]OFX49898.1 MAG: hypothetical protein A2X13_15440 [Bacteroidetes bacterium GWC2_33_15]OFX66210.1 MAG: hypothetical protein A2X15_07045 [Bacteroidetes bacterium GWB2_32_14]OFX70080.1 MAG: hypothetical protein A2X14_05720 [Bacteroidetes bacterium GWD2_33_33]
MKKVIILSLFVGFQLGLFAQKGNTVNDLIHYFKEIRIPFNSDQINLTYKELPYELALKYFFKGDTASSIYFKEVFNQEDYTLMSSAYVRKGIFPVFHYYFSGKLFMIYHLTSEKEDSETILALMDDESTQADKLVIAYATISAPELYNWIRSKIYKDKVIVFEYRRIPLKNRDSTKNATEIIVNFYEIDFNKNKFIQIKTEKYMCIFELYQLNDASTEEVRNADPFYNY